MKWPRWNPRSIAEAHPREGFRLQNIEAIDNMHGRTAVSLDTQIDGTAKPISGSARTKVDALP